MVHATMKEKTMQHGSVKHKNEVRGYLKSLILTRGRYYVGWEVPTNVVYGQILSFFLKIHLRTMREILHRLGSSNHILRRLGAPNRRGISTTISKVSNFEFLFFQSFYMSVICGAELEYGILRQVCMSRCNISSNVYKMSLHFCFCRVLLNRHHIVL